MFAHTRRLSSFTPRGLYGYCPFEGLEPPPRPLTIDRTEVGCLVDSIVNSDTKMHIHPDDFILVLNDVSLMECRVRDPVDPLWASAWVAQIKHITSKDDRNADITVNWAYSSRELLKLDNKDMLHRTVGRIDFGPWGRVLSDHEEVIPSDTVACVLDLSTTKSNRHLYLKDWSLRWSVPKKCFMPGRLRL